MAVLGALTASLVAFVLSLRLLRAEQVGSGVLVAARQASATLFSDLGDDEKERLVRQASARMLVDFLKIAGIGVVSFGVAAGIIWLGMLLGLYTMDEIVTTGSGWPFVIGSTVGAIVLWMLLSRQSDVPYNRMDRTLHRVAFAAPALQKALANVESARYADRIDPKAAERPVFVTSLARAGTTILLEVLAAQREFASATYRHMPFALSPLLWGDLTTKHQQQGAMVERAHGDGLKVSYDSPEAFEEMVWLAHWKRHYPKTHIAPWTGERHPEFEAFFRSYMARVVAATPDATRYVSKNNASIARLPLLQRMCPDATILIPVRNPFAHAASLLRQHGRFSDLHAREPFARRYMEGIGHFEFGAAMRPIGVPREGDPMGHDYWLRYWADTYEGVLRQGGTIIDHDALSTNPQTHLPVLADLLGLSDPQGLIDTAPRFRAPKPVAAPDVDPVLIARVRDIHAELIRKSANV